MIECSYYLLLKDTSAQLSATGVLVLFDDRVIFRAAYVVALEMMYHYIYHNIGQKVFIIQFYIYITCFLVSRCAVLSLLSDDGFPPPVKSPKLRMLFCEIMLPLNISTMPPRHCLLCFLVLVVLFVH